MGVRNPILPGCYPDPTICRVGGDFYLVTSSFEYFPGLPIFHSKDLARWEQIGHVIDRAGMLDMDGMWSSSGLYAPTLRHHDGLFWLVGTLVDQRQPERGGNFVVTATDPAGPWSDPVWLGVDGIDPSLLFDEDGRAWLHGTRPARAPEWRDQTEVWLRELDTGTRQVTGPEYVLWNGALRGAVWAEGPHLYRVDGQYYLIAAEGGTDFYHAVSVARAGHVTGPYVGYRGNPVLSHRQLGRGADIVGVGHADLVEAPDGSWWAVALGMRPYGGVHYNLGRETFIVPVSWEDGWPVFAPGTGRVPVEIPHPFGDTATRSAVQGAAAGMVASSDPRWTTLRRPADEFAERNGSGWLLHVTPATLNEPGTPTFLGVRQQHRDVEVRALFRVDGAPGEEVGLAVRQSEDDHVRLVVVRVGDVDDDLDVVAIHRQGGTEHVLGRTRVSAAPSWELGIAARGQDYELFVARPDGSSHTVAVADGRRLDSVAAGGFLGLWVGVYASSNGAATDTVVELERFDYLPA